jgi:acetylornithine deacetylase/succinyl-diaminopimelate desuccinylase-like protein
MEYRDLNKIYEDRESAFIEGWKRFLAFPSISADGEHDAECRACAEWLVGELGAMGFAAELWETTSAKPVVYAERQGVGGAPVVLFYGHYDVQPVDPLSAWKTPPFEAALRDGRLFARGAQDNKGQIYYTLKALQVLIESGAALPTVKVVIEGEEECGSQGLSESLAGWRDQLQADVLMVHDTGTVRSKAPTITMGLRGIVHLCATLRGADHDLHSGMHGGLAPNPAQGVAQLAASLFDESGAVTVNGFYDGVREPTERERDLAQASGFDPAQYERMVGALPVGGEKGRPEFERTGFRPSLDINGIHSGYGGEGMKTVIPSGAELKLSARLVPDQNPAKVLDAICEHLQQHCPEGMRLTITERTVGGPGFRLDAESELVRKAQAALQELGGASVAYHWEGASIPIVSTLAEISGAEPLLVGFGYDEDHIHAPNESFSLEQFHRGFVYAALILQRLAKDGDA